MDFEWNVQKAISNLEKHGVSFEDACYIFTDPGRIEAFDGRENYGEERWVTIGVVQAALLFVVFTMRRENVIRIISARKANGKERKQYYQAQL